MIKIAFCDDDQEELSKLKDYLFEYLAEPSSVNVEYSLFRSGTELLSAAESGERFDIIFLDVMMPFINGIDTAKELRQFNGMSKIIFLTSSREFAVESYAVKAFQYLLKPIQQNGFIALLRSVLDEILDEEQRYMVVETKNKLEKIFFFNIVYIEIMGRTLYYHLRNGNVLEQFGSMAELAKKLAVYPMFFKSHRSYLVNMDYISNITATEIRMNTGSRIPISRKSHTTVKKAYLEYAFPKRDRI